MYKEFYIGRKHIGTLNGDVFHKEVYLSRHLFRKLDAWGIDSKTLHQLPATAKIELHELEEDKWYRTTKSEFLRLGTQNNAIYLHFKGDEDYRTQIFLPRQHFQVESAPELTEDEIAFKEYKKVMGFQV